MSAPVPHPWPSGELLDPRDPSLWPDLTHVITEDDTPVDNPSSEKQMRLLTEPLYASWPGPGNNRPFRVVANVGLFNTLKVPTLVPDVMLGLDLRTPDDLMLKDHRAWFIWIVGKKPDAVIEIVSNREGGEDTHKVDEYAIIGVPYYVIRDPRNLLKKGVLRGFALREGAYEPIDPSWLPNIGLGLKLWNGTYEDASDEWLRWCDQQGQVIPTGAEKAASAEALAKHQSERAEHEHERAEQERERAEQERQRAVNERQARLEAEARAQLLAEKLRQLGIEP